jgi:hypothetical protein
MNDQGFQTGYSVKDGKSTLDLISWMAYDRIYDTVGPIWQSGKDTKYLLVSAR